MKDVKGATKKLIGLNMSEGRWIKPARTMVSPSLYKVGVRACVCGLGIGDRT